MDNFYDVLRVLSKLYVEESEKHDDESNEESYDEYYEEVLNGLTDEIKSLDSEQFNKIVSILALEYYNIIPNSDTDEILDSMVKDSSEDFIDSIKNNENDYLDVILDRIISCTNYYPDCDYYDYIDMEDRLSEALGPCLYRKFHPNLDFELDGLQKWKNEQNYLKDISHISIESFLEFIELIITVKNKTKNKSGLINSIICALLNLKRENPELFKNIYLYMIQYYYVMVKNSPEMNIINETIINTIEYNAVDALYDENEKLYTFIEKFLSYDVMEYGNVYEKSSPDVKAHVKKLIPKKKTNIE